MRLRQPPVPRDRVQHAVRPRGRAGQRERDVDHGEPGADEQHVGAARPVAAYDVERARRPGSGDEERAILQRLRRPAWPTGGSPVATTTASATRSRPSSVSTATPVAVRRTPVAPGADVPQRRPAAGGRDGLGQRLVEVERELAGGAAKAAGPASTAGSCRAVPRHEVPGVLGERAHARRRDVEQVCLVGGAERDATRPPVTGVEEHHLEAGSTGGPRPAPGGSRSASPPRPRRRSPRSVSS